VLLASAVHATWNLLTKRAGDRLCFLWLGLGAGLVIYLPAAAYIALREPPDPRGWPLVVLSGVIHCGYYWGLSRMYQYDFSLTYPMARGTGPVLVTLASLLLLREPLTGGGLAGIGLVVAGVASLQVRYDPGGGGLRWPLLQALRGPAGQAALFVAAMIACYSLVDKRGVSYINPILYLWSGHFVSFAGYSVWMMRRRERVLAECRRSWREVLVVAVGQNLAYILVLFAMRLAPVAYVVPARETSTLIGSMLGVLLLREPFPLSKLGGAALIVAGVVLIALRG
jgi:drug/metabolite transporter (DMT)-like permease